MIQFQPHQMTVVISKVQEVTEGIGAVPELILFVMYVLEYVIFARLYNLNSCRHQFVTCELSKDLLRRGLLNDRGSYITADLFWSSDAVHVLRGDGLSLRLVLVISNTVN